MKKLLLRIGLGRTKYARHCLVEIPTSVPVEITRIVSAGRVSRSYLSSRAIVARSARPFVIVCDVILVPAPAVHGDRVVRAA